MSAISWKKVDIVTPNGFEDSLYSLRMNEFEKKRIAAREN